MSEPQIEQPNSNNGANSAQAMDNDSLKRVIEALIFASDKPVSVKQMKDIIGDVDTRLIRKLVDELKQEYVQSQRSFDITEVAGGYQFSTNPAYGRWLKKLYNIKQSDYLTGPSLETLAIVAYKQPITKAEIEYVRGVNVDGVVNSLSQKGLIKITGRKEVPGRPFLYGTTNAFLQYFGLNNLEELPALPEFREADLDFQKKDANLTVEVVDEPSNNTGGAVEGSVDEPSNNTGGIEEDEDASEITQEDRLT